MASEVIKLNLIPSGEMPTFHCSQFDNGRLILIDLFNGEDEYSLPAGYTAELHTRKMDNNIVTLATTSVSSNHLTFTSTEQLTACAGNNLSEVSIKDASDYVVGTLNFWLYVEKDPLQGGLTSTSSIHDLTDQIEEITTEIVGENYYNKTETDDLLDLKADKSTTYTKTEVNTLLNSKADASSVYTKSETNTLLSAKADADSVYSKAEVDGMVDDLEDAIDLKADQSTTYTKTQVDTSLALKADAATTYTKTEVDTALALKANAADVYTKTEVDNIILDIMPVDTASGPIASFDTELAVPLVNVSSNIVATGGNGTPDNPIPIVGYSEANITANGNVITIAFGQTVYGGVLDVTRGKLHVAKGYGLLDGSINPFASNFGVGGYVGYTPSSLGIDNIKVDTLFVSNCYENTGSNKISIYNGNILINDSRFGSTINSLADWNDWLTNTSNVQFVYELATPFDIDLTPVQIRALVGENNVYSDTNGNTTVKFKDSIQHYIDTHTGG